MRRPLASVYALTTFFACPAAFAQPAGARPAAETETPLDDEPAEPLGPAQLDVLDELDGLGPALPRSTDRLIDAAPLRLSLLAWREEKVPSGRDQGLGLVLTFPLERLLAPSPPRPFDAPAPARLLSPPSPPLAGGPPALPFVLPVALPAAVTSDALPLALPEALRVTPAQVRAVSEAALHAAGLAGPLDGRLDGLAARSRSSALLPELRVRATQSNDRALRLSYAEADPSRAQASGGSALILEARATWRLDRLVYADDEVAVERLRGDVREQRQRLLLKVVEAIGAWQKAQLVLLDADAAPRERAAAIGQASGAVVLLDALSGGAWSRLRAPARRAGAGR